jgi:NAD(P)-dependent dehydrogenase (short-subunit alcohol dehydrogenase family)
MDFTTQCHLDTYPTLSPKRPELSQAGRTVLVTGGAGGVGLAIAQAFAEAGAARLVLVARRATKLAEAKEELGRAGLEILVYSCDIADAAGVRGVWDDLAAKAVGVDVLVLNAAAANTVPRGLAEEDFVDKVWSTFEVNVLAALRMTDIFLKQGPAKGKVRASPCFRIVATKHEHTNHRCE